MSQKTSQTNKRMKKRQTEKEKLVVMIIITNSSRTKLMTDEFNQIKNHYACTKKNNDDQIFVVYLALNETKIKNKDEYRFSMIIYSDFSFIYNDSIV
jgi:site-specific DNA-adenine methylase